MKHIKDILPSIKPSDMMPVKDIETVNPLIPFQYKDAEIEKSIKLDYRKSWYLSGEPGVGKTHFAYALKRKALPKIERGYVFGIKNLIDFINRLKNIPFEERDFIYIP
jgi:DNA replication protein DnaC